MKFQWLDLLLVELGRMEQHGWIKKSTLAKTYGRNKRGLHKKMFLRIEGWNNLQRRK